MPDWLPPLIYPDHFEVRYVSVNGSIRWKRDWVNASIVCAGGYVGLEEIGDGPWDVNFSALCLGRLHERHMRSQKDPCPCHSCPTTFPLLVSPAAHALSDGVPPNLVNVAHHLIGVDGHTYELAVRRA